MTVIYIDILLALNLFVDFLILAATARILHRPYVKYRLILAALVGALSSLIILAPPLSPFLSLLYKAGVSAVMVTAAFPINSLAAFLKTTGMLWIISGLFSGLVSMGYYLLSPTGVMVQSGVVYCDISPLLLIGLTVMSYVVLSVFDRLTRKRAAMGYCYRLEITDDNCRIMLRAMLDSGHSLQDSFSGAPVILVREAAVRQLRDRYDITNPNSWRGGRIRYIPFSSIGGDGMLAAFRPDKITLYADNRQTDISGVWIATTTVLGRGEYDALIGPAVADMINSPASV